jgi:hypothetical protein
VSRSRGWLVAALVVAVALLGGSLAAVAAGVGRGGATFWPGSGVSDGGGYGPGMMGTGSGPGMMGGYGPGGTWMTGGRFGLAGDGQQVTTMAAAKSRAQAFADQIGGLHAGEVMQFSNGYYSELLTADGAGATEVLIDPGTGAVSLEYGPAMMWNTRFGMHPAGSTTATVTSDEAVADAQAWLDGQGAGLSAAEPMAFPGYYTLHTLKDGRIVGMMSVNAVTGAVWYHTWHGSFEAMIGE